MDISSAEHHLDKPYDLFATEKQWDNYITNLCQDGLSWWFNFDVIRIIHHLTPLQGLPQSISQPPRITLISEAVNPESSLDTIETLYKDFVDQGDTSGAAAACVAGFNVAWNAGIDFKTMDPWIDRIDTILADGSNLTAIVRAALLAVMGYADIVRWGRLRKAEHKLGTAMQWAEKAKANSLRIYIAYAYGYSLIWQGNFAKLDVLDSDIAPLTMRSEAAVIPVFGYQTMKGFYYLLLGDTSACKRILQAIVSHMLFDLMPSGIWLLAYAHLLLAYAYENNVDKVKNLSKTIQQRVVPEQNNFCHGYVHFCLGTAALVQKDPHKALLHCQECDRRTHKSASPIVTRVCALLKGQALIDSDNSAQALNHLKKWLECWQDTSHNLLAAQGALEISHLLQTQGNIVSAKQYYQQATQLVSQLTIVPNPHRGRFFTERLANLLYSESIYNIPWQPLDQARIKILTFGALRLITQNRTIRDQDKNNKPLYLLKAIIAGGGQNVSIDWLLDALWPNVDGDKAYGNFRVTLHRLRNLIHNGKHPPLWIIVKNKRVSLSKTLCSVDALVFKEAIENVNIHISSVRDYGNLLNMYEQDFLLDDHQYPWILSYRNTLRETYLDGVTAMAKMSIPENQPKAALPYLKRALELDPINEALYAGLMKCYLEMGMPSLALKTFATARKELSKLLGIGPGPLLTTLKKVAIRK
jgi:DNA-binding SARP family transcriptional activator